MMVVVFLLLGAGDLLGVHPCPHHEPGAAPAAGQHEGYAPGGAADAGHHGHSESQDEHGACTCQGPCSTAPAGLLPVEPRIEIAVRIALAPSVAVHPRDPLLPRHTRHLLPYAQAPPLG